jgi:UDPglucose 6-dehydrogenase
VTELSTAELTKHAANSFLAMKISFLNMVADVCEAVGADVTKVAAGIGMDPRIGPDFLQAGVGFGGYCFPTDLRAFIHLAEEYGLDFSMLKESIKAGWTCSGRSCGALWVLPGKTIAILGPRTQTRDRRHTRRTQHEDNREPARGTSFSGAARSPGPCPT